MTKSNFYVPNVTFWHWERLTRTFIEVQRKQALESFAQTENALAQLDYEVESIGNEIRSKWAGASVNVMRAFEARLKEVRKERRRIEHIRFVLRGVLDRMNAELSKKVEA